MELYANNYNFVITTEFMKRINKCNQWRSYLYIEMQVRTQNFDPKNKKITN